ncbi:LysM peptidoglycan-binding domain-containing protein [Cytobacillus depressus]|uniref:LysM peptidoglycan-binding domain-containing protein n=1 Tax=Cytobacillus depressus TaxID=1602942 RepID=A0A6L3V5P1_9BACI|nr:3D domain-containing protein [Cytobacillus depressus]KAB2334497.1 LysM peptidoglycan-binding domain-containing protein [Cytobacillus depressus]
MLKYLYSSIAAITIWCSIGAAAQAQEVVVNKGDTLWAIANKHNVSVQEIKKWNGLSTDVIHPNDKLEVSPEKYYIVESGDTLWNIARTNRVPLKDLKEWNNLNSDLIRPGLKLIISQNSAAQGNLPKSLSVTATAYTAYCEGCSGITKTGVDLRANPDQKVIAVDPEVIPLGSKVFVEGYGYATAEDIGSAIKGNKIDLFIPTTEAALQWGRQQVNVTIVN